MKNGCGCRTRLPLPRSTTARTEVLDVPLPNLQRPLNEGVEANQRRGILRELERQQERRRTMPRCCAGDACRHPDVPFLAVAHYCLTCPEGDHRNRGHGPCLVATPHVVKCTRCGSVWHAYVVLQSLLSGPCIVDKWPKAKAQEQG